MYSFRSSVPAGLLRCLGLVASPVARCADIIGERLKLAAGPVSIRAMPR
jgi:hypothetical protein